MSDNKVRNQTRLKSALVKTRNTIKKKYHKVHNERVKGELKLKEKYAPITDSIQKLVDLKKNKPRIVGNVDIDDDGLNIDLPNDLDGYDYDDYMAHSDDHEWNNLDHAGAAALAPVRVNRKRDRDLLSDDSSVVEVDGKKYQSQFAKELMREQKKRNKEELHNIRKDGAQRSRKKILEHGINKRRVNSLDTYDRLAKKRDIESGDEGLSESDLILETRNKKRATRKKSKSKNKLHEMRQSYKKNPEPAPVEVELSPEDFIGENNTFTGSVPKRTKAVIPLHRFDRVVQKRRAELTDSVRRSRRHFKRPPFTYGKGLENEFIPYTENIAYEYYDDPNELCDRLKLLVSSKQAGNTNHDQEINSIIEELRESDIIE